MQAGGKNKTAQFLPLSTRSLQIYNTATGSFQGLNPNPGVVFACRGITFISLKLVKEDCSPRNKYNQLKQAREICDNLR